MKKIAFYNPTNISFGSGPEIWLKNMLPLFISNEFHVTVFTTKFHKKDNYKESYDFFESLGINIIEIKSFNLPLSGSPIPIGFLQYIFKKEKFDLFYTFSGYAFQDIFGLLCGKIFKTKTILGIHGPTFTGSKIHNLYQKIISLPFSYFSNYIHILNKNDLSIYSKYSNNTFINGCGVVNLVTKDEIIHIKEKYIHSNVCKFIFVGRLSAQKNIHKMLEIFSSFKDYKNIEFYIVGDGELRNLVIENEKKCKNIKYLGYINNEIIHNIYKDKHYFIHLSNFETFGISLLEALSFGMNVITTKTNGIASDYGKDFLFDQLNLDFSIDDGTKSIKLAVETFFTDKEYILEKSLRAKELSLKFSWEKIFKEFIKFIY